MNLAKNLNYGAWKVTLQQPTKFVCCQFTETEIELGDFTVCFKNCILNNAKFTRHGVEVDMDEIIREAA